MADDKKKIGSRGRIVIHWPLAIGIVLFLIVIAACVLYQILRDRS